MADEEITPTKPDEEQFYEFSTKRKPFRVKIDGEEYELRVMTGDQVGDYRNGMGNRIKYVGGKPAGMIHYRGLESTLICRCMFLAGKSEAVTEKFVNSLPQDVIDKLFQKCRAMNALDEKAEESEKKE